MCDSECEDMADCEDLVEEAFLYITEKRYPDGASASRKRQIRKKSEKFTVIDGELYYKPGKDKQVKNIGLHI